MVQAVRDSFLDLERHRHLLEGNIEKLQKSLRDWQTWEAEYEGLKEEILSAKSAPTRQQLVIVAREYEGELINKKEIEEILGPNDRDAAQVVNILDRRIDYVQQNVRTLEKQIETAHNKLAAASVISTPDVRNEEGLPLTEIIEELDEEGNVIASHTSTPRSVKPQLLEALQKAGVPLPAGSPASESVPAIEDKPKSANKSSVPAQGKVQPNARVAKPAKKGVKFTEDTKAGPEPEKSQTAKRIEEIMSLGKQADEKPSEPPVIPTNESQEDAALRREMLLYGMSEVGSVVAELDLEDASDWSEEDYQDGTSDDEDLFGRSTGRVVDDELRQRMIELEQRLGARMMENIGKKASNYDIVDEGIGRITINGQGDGAAAEDAQSKPEEENPSDATSVAYTKKSVRFSEELDISPAPQSPAAIPPAANMRATAPVSDIVERTVPVQSTVNPVLPKKTSRFKSSRACPSNVVNEPLVACNTKKTAPPLPLFPAKPSASKPFSQSIHFSPVSENTRTVPTGPEGKTLAPQVVERDAPLNTPALEPDELDPQLLHQEVATEYYRMRNRMIQRQGGFMKEEESEIVSFTEEEGGPKKMSRFKAARLARS